MEALSAANLPAASTEDRLQRPEWAAWYLNVKTSWIYEAVRAGRLPCHRVGRHIRFTRLMLDEWLAEQATPEVAGPTPVRAYDKSHLA